MFFSNTYFSDCMNEKVIQTKENPQVCLVYVCWCSYAFYGRYKSNSSAAVAKISVKIVNSKLGSVSASSAPCVSLWAFH